MTKEVTIDYVRCPDFSYVYEATADRCPNCNKVTIINESELDQKVFNLND